MFETLQKILLNKAIGKTEKKTKPTAKGRKKQPDSAEMRTQSGIALDDAIQKLEGSGHKMEDLLAQNEKLLADVKAEAAKKMTPERRALIESAMKVRKTKAKILEDLDDETRAKLYLTALRAFTGKQ